MGVRVEWHLLKLFRVTMFSDVLSHDRTRFAEQRIGFGSSFDGTWLDTTWTITDVLLGDEYE